MSPTAHGGRNVPPNKAWHPTQSPFAGSIELDVEGMLFAVEYLEDVEKQ
jgi:hypothetical protein